jgi:hypothetical protein
MKKITMAFLLSAALLVGCTTTKPETQSSPDVTRGLESSNVPYSRGEVTKTEDSEIEGVHFKTTYYSDGSSETNITDPESPNDYFNAYTYHYNFCENAATNRGKEIAAMNDEDYAKFKRLYNYHLGMLDNCLYYIQDSMSQNDLMTAAFKHQVLKMFLPDVIEKHRK